MRRPLKYWSTPISPGFSRVIALAAIVTTVAVIPAWCAEARPGASEAQLIGQIVLLIVAGRLLGEVMGIASTIPNWNKGWPHWYWMSWLLTWPASCWVGLLLAGRLIEVAPTEAFFAQPSDPRTAAFVRGDMIY